MPADPKLVEAMERGFWSNHRATTAQSMRNILAAMREGEAFDAAVRRSLDVFKARWPEVSPSVDLMADCLRAALGGSE
jgi:hypothetical protein